NNSPLIREYRNQALSIALDSQLIAANFRPQINATITNIYAPVFNNFGYDEAISNGGTYTGMVSATKTFVGAANRTAQLRSAGLMADSAVIASKSSVQDLRRTITAQYITAFGDLQQYRSNRQIHELLIQEDMLFKELTRKNVYTQTDYLTFLVTLKQQQLQLKQSWIQYQTDFANLNYLCGIFDTNAASTTLELPSFQVPVLPDPNNSIFLYKYTLDSLRLSNQISLINYSYKPRVDVFGDVGYASSRFTNILHTFGFSGGFTLTIPIYDGSRRKFNIAKLKLEEDTRINYRSFFVRQYYQQIAQIRQQLQSAEELLGAINEQIEYTEGLIKVNQQLLQTGDVKVSDFIIAINNYLTAKFLATQNSVNKLQIINQLNYWNK
ncbi:MAG: TolC family protein, partial [Sphingobacteriales bacterium]